jgi:YD repeat-containing protein
LEILSSYKANYDENGNLTKGINYVDSVPTSKYEADYDENGNLTSERRYTGYSYKSEDKFQLDYKILYDYDQDSNLITETHYNEYSELDYKYFYYYDKYGNLTEAENTDGNGKFVSKYHAIHNENQIIEFSVTGPQGEIQTKHKAEYENGNMILEIDCSVPGQSKKILEADYDENGNKTLEINYQEEIGSDVFISKNEYIYDERNNCIEEIYSVFYPEIQEWLPISKQTVTIKYY